MSTSLPPNFYETLLGLANLPSKDKLKKFLSESDRSDQLYQFLFDNNTDPKMKATLLLELPMICFKPIYDKLHIAFDFSTLINEIIKCNEDWEQNATFFAHVEHFCDPIKVSQSINRINQQYTDVLNKGIKNDFDLVKLYYDSLYIDDAKEKTSEPNYLKERPLFHALGKSCLAFLDRTTSTPSNKVIDFAKLSISIWYFPNTRDLAKMIFTSSRQKNNPYEDPLLPPMICYHNNEGYSSADNNGNRLFLGLTPIGYNIHLPPEKCKNALVIVYGGFQAAEKETKAFRPGSLGFFEKYLLQNGCAIITLNLPDLLKLNVPQSEMPKDLYDEIQASIELFYQTLKRKPELLHPDLPATKLHEKNIFLYGASFGGALVMVHAEEFPGTYSGYISHDGTVSTDMWVKSDLLNRLPNKPWLNPAQPQAIEKINEPLLLMQNRDDNNVNVKTTLDFYKQLKKRNKDKLARICITDKGNPIPNGDKANKGHFMPTESVAFVRYTSVLLDFMEQGVGALPAMTVWQAYKQDKLANKFYKAATLEQKFIAQVLQNASLAPPKNQQEANLLSAAVATSNKAWEEHYQGIYYALYYTEKLIHDPALLVTEIDRLQKQNLLSDEVLQNTLDYQVNVFSQYTEEKNNLQIPYFLFKKNQQLLNNLKEILLTLDSKDKATLNYLLTSLYVANPNLLQALYPQFTSDLTLNDDCNKARQKLTKTLSTERKMITAVWQEAFKGMRDRDSVRGILSRLNKSLPKAAREDFDLLAKKIKLSKLDKANKKITINSLNNLITRLMKLSVEKDTSPADLCIIRDNMINIKLLEAICFEDPDKIKKSIEDAVVFFSLSLSASLQEKKVLYEKYSAGKIKDIHYDKEILNTKFKFIEERALELMAILETSNSQIKPRI